MSLEMSAFGLANELFREEIEPLLLVSGFALTAAVTHLCGPPGIRRGVPELNRVGDLERGCERG